MPHSRSIQNTPPALAAGLASLYSDLVTNLQNSGGIVMHYARVDGRYVSNKRNIGAVDQSLDFTPIAALDDAGCQARANKLLAALLAHLQDGTHAHAAADASSFALITHAPCTDVSTCTALLLDLQAAWNQHAVTRAPHTTIPAFNPLTTITPSDAASNITGLNELLQLYKRHFYAAAEQISVGSAG